MYFITIEGPNGSGKTTLAEAVSEELRRRRRIVVPTSEPTNSALGKMVRELEGSLSGRAYACLVAADRHFHVATTIEPNLATGAIVISDRYIESSLVLQYIDGVPRPFIMALHEGITIPDMSVHLRVDPGILADRLRQRRGHSRFEALPDSSRREFEAYEEVADLLREDERFTVLTIDYSHRSVPDAVALIVSSLPIAKNKP